MSSGRLYSPSEAPGNTAAERSASSELGLTAAGPPGSGRGAITPSGALAAGDPRRDGGRATQDLGEAVDDVVGARLVQPRV